MTHRIISAARRRAAGVLVLAGASLAALSACSSGTEPGALRIRVSGVLTSATTGHPLQFGGVTLYALDPAADTRTPLASAVASTNGGYVLSTDLQDCDEALLEIEASAFGYEPLVYDGSSDPHVRCTDTAQAISFRLSPAVFPSPALTSGAGGSSNLIAKVGYVPGRFGRSRTGDRGVA